MEANLARAETPRRNFATVRWIEIENAVITISLGEATRRNVEIGAHLMVRADIALYAVHRSRRDVTVEAG